MNDEINKENNNNRIVNKRSWQNPLFIFFVIAIIVIILTVIYGFIEDSQESYGWLLVIVFFFALPVLFIMGALAKAGATSIDYIKNKEQWTLPERKIKKKWFVFNLFFFLFLPVVAFIGVFIGLFINPSFLGYVVSLSFLLLLAGGVEIIIKNKNNNMPSRMSGWLLVSFGLIPVIMYLFNKIIN